MSWCAIMQELGDILRLGEKIKKLEKYLVDCHEQKTETEKEMLKLLGSLLHYIQLLSNQERTKKVLVIVH